MRHEVKKVLGVSTVVTVTGYMPANLGSHYFIIIL